MSDDIETIEVTLTELKNAVALRDKALKLSKTPEFKAVIVEGFIQGESARLVAMIGDNQFDQDGVQNDLLCIAAFQRYLRRIELTGDMAEKAVIDHEEALNEMRQEAIDEQ